MFHPVGLRFEVYGDICRYQVLKGHSKQPWGVRLEADRPARKQLQKQRGDQGLDIHFGAFNLQAVPQTKSAYRFSLKMPTCEREHS